MPIMSRLMLGTKSLAGEVWTLVLWVALEAAVIIICACIPTIRPLFRTVSGKSAHTTGSSYGKLGNSNFRKREDSSTELTHMDAVHVP